MISRRTLLGLMVGRAELLCLGSTMMFVLAGVSLGRAVQGHVFGLFIALGGVAQLAGGYAIAIRLFYQRQGYRMDQAEALKKTMTEMTSPALLTAAVIVLVTAPGADRDGLGPEAPAAG